MLERTELLYQARNVFIEGGYVFNEHPYRSASFDFVARSVVRRKHIFIVKVILNLESVTGQHAVELLLISEMLDATPIVLGARSNNAKICDNVIYKRHGVPALNLQTLKFLLLEEQIPVTRAKRGGQYINISPKKLRELRIKKSLSLKDVARTLNLSVKTIRSYESGDTIPTAENAERLTNLLGEEIIQPIEIFKKREQPLPKERLAPKSPLQQSVHELLVDLDVEVLWFDSAPVDGICQTRSHSDSSSDPTPTIITGVAPAVSAVTVRRMNNAVTIARITRKQAFFIVQHKSSNKKLTLPLPTLRLSRLEQINEQEEFFKVLRKKKK